MTVKNDNNKVEMKEKTHARGKCNCGTVRFEILCPITDVYVCHCSICRAYSGSSNSAVVVVPKQKFNLTHGEDHIRIWQKPGHDWESHFCSICGSSLPGENDADHLFVPAGLIVKGGENLRVVNHQFIDSKASWETISENEEKA